MSNRMITVTVAPGGAVRIPHPSGLAQLGQLTLREGETLQVDYEEALRLFDRGDVLHPDTGMARPVPTRIEGPTISYEGGPPIPLSNTAAVRAAAAAYDRKALKAVNDRIEAERQQSLREGGTGMQPLRQTGPTEICHDQMGVFADIAAGRFW